MGNAFLLIGQKWVETNKNEIRDDEAGRDYTSHDLFRVYELVTFNSCSVNYWLCMFWLFVPSYSMIFFVWHQKKSYKSKNIVRRKILNIWLKSLLNAVFIVTLKMLCSGLHLRSHRQDSACANLLWCLKSVPQERLQQHLPWLPWARQKWQAVSGELKSLQRIRESSWGD